MNLPVFTASEQVINQIDAYFKATAENVKNENKPKSTCRAETAGSASLAASEAEPATISGLALFLGFNSLDDFEEYEQTGQFAASLQRARLRMEAIYERKLLQQSPTGAIFALKSFGWDERSGNKNEKTNTVKTLTIEIIETGFQPAGDEKEVAL